MEFSLNIRQLYRPLQPTVKQTTENVSYVEVAPGEQLLPYIYCYWQLKTDKSLQEPFTYRVVADGCIDIYFELNAPYENYVMGFCKKYTEFPLQNSFNYVGIRFLPTMFPQLFQVNAKALSNRYLHLKAVNNKLSAFISSAFHGNQSLDVIARLLNDYFIKHISTLSFAADNRLYNALEIIFRNQGMVAVEKELDTGISARQLRRLFDFYIGDTAKTFAKVVRFQNILNAKPSTQSLRNNKLFFDAGYYDQAHFIREFKNFYGVTPSKAFGR
ncbi:AraC family transcriptional regulator [Longitalea luteola]|uniref:AraC family transcriptional regulator n=1 Tax=Longitalea luteola TaxID=2812563 RepID=UPI001A95A202|nr:helix-turn-helix domain-containing protein [Longitalea luteola]